MTSMDWVMTRQRLERAVDRTVHEFRDNPWDFLSENDIQSLLFAELRREMRELRNSYQSSCRKDRHLGAFSDINPVKTEYQLVPDGKGMTCDIAVLCHKQDQSSNLWRQPCRVAIEIKFWQAAEGGVWSDLLRDIEKLQLYWAKRNPSGQPFTGIAMLFVHPGAKPCADMSQIRDIERGSDFPESGVAIHVVNKGGHRWSTTPASVQLAATAPGSN